MFSYKLLALSLISSLLLSFSIAEFQSDYLKKSIQRGDSIYITNCENCHLADGSGAAPLVPSLHNSDRIMDEKNTAIRQVLHGLDSAIVINGVAYNAGTMPLQAELSDQEVADVLNYIRNSWGNQSKEAVQAVDVANER